MKDARIHIRIDDALKARLQRVCERTGINETLVISQCLAAFCDYVDQHGSAAFPLLVQPRKLGRGEYPEPRAEAAFMAEHPGKAAQGKEPRKKAS